MRLMNNAITEATLPAEVDHVLRAFFDEMSTFLINE